MLLTGCASRQPAAGGTASDTVRPDRDGPPQQPPPDLAALPDAEPRVEPIRRGGPNKAYAVLGRAYEPLASDVAFRERGAASWYGTKFHGRRTASGEVYSMYGMTAAHRTLPIPSYARVRNVRSGKSVIVRINDRGPFHGDRVIDLSYTAAVKLDMLRRGSVEVEVERLTFEQIRTGQWREGTLLARQDEPSAVPSATGEAATTASTPAARAGVQAHAPALAEDDPIFVLASRLASSAPQEGVVPAEQPLQAGPRSDDSGHARESRSRAFTPASKGFWVQLAAFGQRGGVDAFQQRVAQEMSHLSPLLAVFQEGSTYRLQAGPYAGREEAQSVARRVRDALRLTPMVVERR